MHMTWFNWSEVILSRLLKSFIWLHILSAQRWEQHKHRILKGNAFYLQHNYHHIYHMFITLWEFQVYCVCPFQFPIDSDFEVPSPSGQWHLGTLRLCIGFTQLNYISKVNFFENLYLFAFCKNASGQKHILKSHYLSG